MMTVQVCEVVCWRHAQYAARVGITDLSGAGIYALTADLKASQMRIRIKGRNVNGNMKHRDSTTRRIDAVFFLFAAVFFLLWLIARMVVK